MRSTTLRPVFALALLPIAACGPPPAAEAPPTARVENEALALALASVPEPFEVAANNGDDLRFSTTRATGGTVAVTVGEEEYGLNLLAAAKEQGDAFEAMPGGEYNGSRELGTPFGPAYYSRGSYDAEAGREEQTWIFALHPSDESRMLKLVYTYPAGEGQTRVNELLSLVGEIEALAPPAS